MLFDAHEARAQACCAGAAAVSPGRLMLHETALIGARLRAATSLGSYDARASFHGNPSGSNEFDFEQAVFGSLRFLRRGQAGAVLPLLESWRRSESTGAEFGSGLGDLALSARYDFVWAGQNSVVPGLALLVGLSLPTGRAPEAARKPLASDATGVGAPRASLGVALEQTFDQVLLGASALVAKRADREVGSVSSARAIEWWLSLAFGYSFENDVGAACTVSYAFEANSSVDGDEVPRTSKRSLEVGAALSVPLGEHFRTQAAAFVTPPLSGAGQNQLAETGLTFSLIRSFP